MLFNNIELEQYLKDNPENNHSRESLNRIDDLITNLKNYPDNITHCCQLTADKFNVRRQSITQMYYEKFKKHIHHKIISVNLFIILQ